jgi:3-hydroxy-9,10-secoandrosta-1,3,5(10)-triene-9,17-dione monooxygenase
MQPEECVARARALVPALSARASDCEAGRAIPAETIADLRAAGFLRILQPKEYGGHGLGLETLVAVVAELGRGCGSSAWAAAVLALHAQLVTLFEPAARDEVLGGDPDAVVAAVFAPAGQARRTASGFRVSGRWRFATACDHAGWVAVTAPVAGAALGGLRIFLLPAREVRIEDDWFVTGLRGTGSKTVVVDDGRVPEHRTLSLLDVARGAAPGAVALRSPLLRLPLVPALAVGGAAPALGLARGAMEAFDAIERDRHGQSTALGPRAASRFRRRGMAEATVDAAELLLGRAAARLMAPDGFPADRHHRAGHRAAAAWVVRACARVVEGLASAAGAAALAEASPLARAGRDLRALSAHGILQLDGAAELVGRLAAGHPPRGVFT